MQGRQLRYSEKDCNGVDHVWKCKDDTCIRDKKDCDGINHQHPGAQMVVCTEVNCTHYGKTFELGTHEHAWKCTEINCTTLKKDCNGVNHVWRCKDDTCLRDKKDCDGVNHLFPEPQPNIETITIAELNFQHLGKLDSHGQPVILSKPITVEFPVGFTATGSIMDKLKAAMVWIDNRAENDAYMRATTNEILQRGFVIVVTEESIAGGVRADDGRRLSIQAAFIDEVPSATSGASMSNAISYMRDLPAPAMAKLQPTAHPCLTPEMPSGVKRDSTPHIA